MRYRLCTLFFLIAILALVLFFSKQYLRQHYAISKLRAAGVMVDKGSILQGVIRVKGTYTDDADVWRVDPSSCERINDHLLRDWISYLRELDKLELSLYCHKNTDITDAGIETVVRLPNLRGLFLGGSRIADKSLAHLGKNNTIEVLGLGFCDITDEGIQQLRHMPRLTALYLNETHVTQEGIEQLKSTSPSLQYVELN